MEVLREVLALFIPWFSALTGPLKLAVVAGFLVPLLALYNYLHPAPPPPPPPPDGTVVLPDGKRANLYIDGEAYILRKPRK